MAIMLPSEYFNSTQAVSMLKAQKSSFFFIVKTLSVSYCNKS